MKISELAFTVASLAFSQNHKRLHFGLGEHAVVDRVVVHWPGGVIQELAGVAADAVLRIREPE